MNVLRLWLQLVRDVTIVPSGMGHFRSMQNGIRERTKRGDVWMLMRALEEVGCCVFCVCFPGGEGGGGDKEWQDWKVFLVHCVLSMVAVSSVCPRR